MKKDQTRALNAFASLESLPDGMLLEAEQALMAAEGGVITPVKKPKGGFARFMRSGWSVAAMVSIVALAVLILVLRAGKEPTVYPPTVYPPPVQPVGSTIETSDRGVNFTIATELENYPDGTDLIKVVMTGKVKGEPFSGFNGWHLERITEEGCEFVPISFGFLGLDSIKPDPNEYAAMTVRIHIYGTTLKAGSYRLHATEHDGEKAVSVAWCEFTVGNPDGNTETPPTMEYPPADERPYTVTTPDSIGYGTAELPVTVKTTETDVDLVFHRNYRIVKLIGPANGPGADWVPDLEAVRESPNDGHGGYAVFEDYLTLPTPEDWLPGLYRLYALNDGGEYIDYCDFVITGDHGRSFEMFLNETAITTLHTALSAKIIPHEKGVSFGGGNQWALYRVEGEGRTRIGSRSTEEAFEPPEVAPDEFCVVSRFASIMDLTGEKNLPAGRYELVYDPNGHAVILPFTVAEAANPPLTTDDPEQAVTQGVFFWASGEPFIHLPTMGDVYPVRFTVENNAIDFKGLTTGDTVEIIMSNYIEELFPAHSRLYDLRKVSDGTPSDLPAAVRDAMTEAGYTVTEYPVATQILTGYFLPDGPGGLLITDTGEVIFLRLSDGYEISFDELTTGDRVEATTWDTILASWPEQTDLFAIRKLSDGSSTDIPADVLAKLDENDWYREED